MYKRHCGHITSRPETAHTNDLYPLIDFLGDLVRLITLPLALPILFLAGKDMGEY